MESIRILVVDDEPLGRERVSTLLAQRTDCTVIAECTNGQEAIEALESNPIDLIFLDIHMPEKSGLEVIHQVGIEEMPPVIFVTAYDQHAIEAFKLRAFDYLLKPYSVHRFNEAVDHAIERLNNNKRSRLSNLLNEVLNKEPFPEVKKDRILIKERSKISFIRIRDIDWIESAGNYVKIHIQRKHHLLRQTMTSLESQLDSNQFMRIHRSTIINIDRLHHLYPMASGEYEVSLTDGTKLTMSRTYRHNLERFS